MLETELKKLNANIEKLVAAIEGVAPVKDAVYELNATLEAHGPDTPIHSNESVKDVVEKAVGKKAKPKADVDEPKAEEPKADVDEPKAEETKYFTGDDIKSMALAISRKDRSKQRQIKAKLADHDAKLATDLKGNDLQVVGQWLQNLKDEIGA